MTETNSPRLSRLVDTLDELVFTFEETGGLLEWNRAVTDVTDYSGEALSGKPPTGLFEGKDAARVTAAVEEALETGSATVEADLLTADGDRIPYEFDVHRRPDDRPVLVGIGREITERGAAERAWRETLDRMSDAFFAVDTGWRLTYVNGAGRRILSAAMGREPSGALEGLHLWEEIPEAVDTVFYERYHEAMATQEQVTFEEYYEPLETWFEVRVHPSETGLSIYLSDVTERRRRREAVEGRERVLREMYEVIADRGQPFAEKVEALLALGRAELGTEYGTLSEIRGDEYVFEVVDAEDDSVQAGDAVPLSATFCEMAASTERTVVVGDVARDVPVETDRAGYTELGISCYLGAPVLVDGAVYGTFCFYDTDPREGQFSEWEVTLVDLMSRWVGYELQRKQANERLQRQNDRLEAFVSTVSHDLRNPLSVLGGSLELAEETGDPAHFERCHAAAERMDVLIDDLLALAQAGAVIDDVGDVALESVLEECWRNVSTAEASLRIETERTVRADESRLRELFENLIRNSIQHGGGAVTVRVGDLPDGFYVEDDGPGIPREERDTVFESGYTTSEDGTGFGLAIAREIVEAHGWTVAVTGSEAGGSRFEITGVETIGR